MENQQRIQEMQRRLEAVFHDCTLYIKDDSHLHAGHAGASSGRGHFTLEISANEFVGMSRLKQQQAIYSALGDMMQNDIHALVIRVLTR